MTRFRIYLACMGVVLVATLLADIVYQFDRSSASFVFVLAVIFAGVRFGPYPAIYTAFLSFLAFDYFIVPPLGFAVSQMQLGILVRFLVSALATSVITAPLGRARIEAEEASQVARAVSDLTISALRSPDTAFALKQIADRGAGIGAIASFSVIDMLGVKPNVIGDPLTEDELERVERAHDTQTGVGCEMRQGILTLGKLTPGPNPTLIVVPLRSGAVAARIDQKGLDPKGVRLLATFIAFIDLLLERERASRFDSRRPQMEEAKTASPA